MAQKLSFQLHITGPNVAQRFDVPAGRTTIGRQSDNDLQLNHPLVSRRHAQLDASPDGCRITDLGSSNGTRVDGVKLTPNIPAPLEHQASIKIGPFELVFEASPVEAPRAAERPVEKAEPATPPAEPPPPYWPAMERMPPEDAALAPGLSSHSRLLLDYLPGIYHTDFMSRFLALFESILIPIVWNVDNFDLYLDPGTAPSGFLPWLAGWFQVTFDATWSEAARRTLLQEAHRIYARRGTRWALSRVLEIYTGQAPEIVDQGQDLDPFTFIVRLPLREGELNRELIEAIVDANKPAHTTYQLEYAGK